MPISYGPQNPACLALALFLSQAFKLTDRVTALGIGYKL